MNFCAQHFTISTGLGEGTTELNAFDSAMQDAHVGNYNLLRVSSILPPHCVARETIEIPQGCLLPIAYSYLTSTNSGNEITAAIGVGIPVNGESVGVIMEYSGYTTRTNAEKNVRKMIEEAMNNRGIDIKNIIIRSRSALVKECTCVFSSIALW